MDLKSIFEQENHGVGTTLMGYDFYISPERNIYNAIRKKYKDLALKAKDKFAKLYEELTDINDLLDNVPDAFIVSIEDALLEVLQDIISIDIYTIDKDKVVEMAFSGEYFDDFSNAFEKIYNEVAKIIAQVDNEKYARTLRKESRPRWTSATIGGNAINAWSNQIDAAGMNLVEGVAHSAVNAIGNLMTEIWADGELNKIYKSKIHKQNLIDSVYYSCFNLHYLLIEIVRRNSGVEIGGTVSAADEQKSQAMFNNFISINLDEDKKAKFINDIFQYNPYNSEYYKRKSSKICKV